MPTPRTLTFQVLVEKTEGAFVGHCLDTGLVAVADEEIDVLAAMAKMLERLIDFALQNGRLRDIYHRAPQEVWDKWMRIEERVISRNKRELPPRAYPQLEHTHSIPGFMIEQIAMSEQTLNAAHC